MSESVQDLVIVGGGPFCTYALERLASILGKGPPPERCAISIFERTGEFGAGAVHSARQAPTSFLNRVAAQVAFGADASNVDESLLLPQEFRQTFFEWARAKFALTGDQQYNLRPHDIPRRCLHGQALAEMFMNYLALLRRIPNVSVALYPTEVIDISRDDDGTWFQVHADADHPGCVKARQILFVTGQPTSSPPRAALTGEGARHEKTAIGGRYISQVYPLQRQIGLDTVPSGCTVGVLGQGLTAIDAILHLTEGRGGVFVEHDADGPLRPLHYRRSGQEPAAIVTASQSGMFVWCRPKNMKVRPEDGASLDHVGVFFTADAVRRLRQSVGKPTVLSTGLQKQLDFELHVFPLVVLEMAYVYYTTLLGGGFAPELRCAVETRYRNFLSCGCTSRDSGTDDLLEPLQQCFAAAAAYIRCRIARQAPPAELRRFDAMGVYERFRATVCDCGADPEQGSPWGHSLNIDDHRFDWRKLLDPLDLSVGDSEPPWQHKLLEFMKRDLLAAAQGNLANPVKAACDGVWRDLRAVFCEVADFGGLTAESQRRFVNIYLRYYNRISNGPGIDAMRRVIALIEAGLVDVSVGPMPEVRVDSRRGCYLVTGRGTRVKREVEVIIEGRLASMDIEHSTHRLYQNMYRRGLIRRWINPGGGESEDYSPGAPDISADNHPFQKDGTIDCRLTFLGGPVEGAAFFRAAAARPHSGSSVLNAIARWADEFTGTIKRSAITAGPEAADLASHV